MLNTLINLGSSQAGKNLEALVMDADNNVIFQTSTNFIEIGNGVYVFSYELESLENISSIRFQVIGSPQIYAVTYLFNITIILGELQSGKNLEATIQSLDGTIISTGEGVFLDEGDGVYTYKIAELPKDFLGVAIFRVIGEEDISAVALLDFTSVTSGNCTQDEGLVPAATKTTLAKRKPICTRQVRDMKLLPSTVLGSGNAYLPAVSSKQRSC